MRKRKITPAEMLDFGKGRHGGKRARAGRKRRSREVHHAKRPEFVRDSVIHITIGFREDLSNLRRKKEAKAIWNAVTKFRSDGSVTEDEFRLLHLSIQRDHLHLGVEAQSRERLSSAVQRIKQRIANSLRKLWQISGTIFRGRYHMRLATTPTEVRRMISYILGNGRHHGAWKHASTDPYSTAYWFESWHADMHFTPPCEPESIISKARSFMARSGWKRAGRRGPLHITKVSLP